MTRPEMIEGAVRRTFQAESWIRWARGAEIWLSPACVEYIQEQFYEIETASRLVSE